MSKYMVHMSTSISCSVEIEATSKEDAEDRIFERKDDEGSLCSYTKEGYERLLDARSQIVEEAKYLDYFEFDIDASNELKEDDNG